MFFGYYWAIAKNMALYRFTEDATKTRIAGRANKAPYFIVCDD